MKHPSIPANISKISSFTSRSSMPTSSISSRNLSFHISRSTSTDPNVNATAQTLWTAEQLLILQKKLRNYPSKEKGNIRKYVEIAASFPDKTIRDVAFQATCLNRSLQQISNDMIQESHQEFVQQVKKRKINDAAEDNNRENADDYLDFQVDRLLQDNIHTINKIRENMLKVKLSDNIVLMEKFKANFGNIMSMLDSINTQMPPLPVEIDTSLLSSFNSSTPSNQIDI